MFTAVFYHMWCSLEEGVGKPVVRYSDGMTAGLIMAYLLVARKVESAVLHLFLEDMCAAGEADAESTSTGHWNYLLASRSRRENGDCWNICLRK